MTTPTRLGLAVMSAVTDSFSRDVLSDGGTRNAIDVRREVRWAGDDPGPGDEYARTQSYFHEPGEWLPLSPGALPTAGGGGGGSAAFRRDGGSRQRWVPNCPNPPDPWTSDALTTA